MTGSARQVLVERDDLERLLELALEAGATDDPVGIAAQGLPRTRDYSGGGFDADTMRLIERVREVLR